MSDHISGPRAIADPVTDITDVFAFPCPERPEHLVLIMNVFPYAGPSAVFSDAVIYRLRVRSAAIASDRRGFTVGADEFVFDCTFDVPAAKDNGAPLVQRGRCTMPSGEVVPFDVNDQNGGTGKWPACLCRSALGSLFSGRPDDRKNHGDRAACVQESRFRQTLWQECSGNCSRNRMAHVAQGRAHVRGRRRDFDSRKTPDAAGACRTPRNQECDPERQDVRSRESGSGDSGAVQQRGCLQPVQDLHRGFSREVQCQPCFLRWA